MISPSKLKIQAINWFIVLFALLISTRPLFNSAGDFLIYLKGSIQILNGQSVYAIDFAPFGTRFFNGPVWAYMLSPLTLVSPELALFVFRFISLAVALSLCWCLAPGSREQKFLITSLFMLWFPFRMNMNLAQGASIAAALSIFVAAQVGKRTWNFIPLAVSTLALTISANFKPTLLVYFLIYLFIKKQMKIIISFVSFNLLFSLFQFWLNPKASYVEWFLLMLERSGRISEGDFSNIVGPWAFVARIFHIDPMLIGLISFAVTFIILTILFRARRDPFDFRESAVLLSVSVLIGPYSPAQDSFLLSLVLVISIPQVREMIWTRAFFVVVSSFWTLSTEESTVKSLLLLGVISVIILKLFNSVRLFLLHFAFSCLILILSHFLEYDHATYDIAGLGSLLSCIYLFLNQIKGRKSHSAAPED